MMTRKQGTWPVLAYVEEVSRLLPDNTWVQQLDVKTSGRTREVQITGETASSSKLIEVLEQSTILQNAASKGTVTRGSTPGLGALRHRRGKPAAPLPPPAPAARDRPRRSRRRRRGAGRAARAAHRPRRRRSRPSTRPARATASARAPADRAPARPG
jgi:hypothetical protein